MKVKMNADDYEKTLLAFGWRKGLEEFDEAMMYFYDANYPEISLDLFVCKSYEAIAFSLKIRDNLRLVGFASEINEFVNRRLINYRKSGKLKSRIYKSLR